MTNIEAPRCDGHLKNRVGILNPVSNAHAKLMKIMRFVELSSIQDHCDMHKPLQADLRRCQTMRFVEFSSDQDH